MLRPLSAKVPALTFLLLYASKSTDNSFEPLKIWSCIQYTLCLDQISVNHPFLKIQVKIPRVSSALQAIILFKLLSESCCGTISRLRLKMHKALADKTNFFIKTVWNLPCKTIF